MKKLTIADIKATEILSKDERKMVVGGSGIIGGSDDTGEGGTRYSGKCDMPHQYFTWEARDYYECVESGRYSCIERLNVGFACTPILKR